MLINVEKEPLVSIIIPTYNSEKYIDICLTSLINQTLKNIEIILIDDGSTDSTLEKINSYKQMDNRIKVLVQNHAKQGAARNKGLDIARGKYITFVNSDDWVNNSYCENLYKTAKEYNVNIAAATITRDYKNKIKTRLTWKNKQTYSGANEIVKALDMHLNTCGKLYKFTLIKGLRFAENTLYEDAPYSIRAIYAGNSMVTVPEAQYHYVANPKSTIRQKSNIKIENDKISAGLDVINFAQEKYIDIADKFAIIKKNYLLFSIKYYKNYRKYYFCGIHIYSKKIQFNNKKIFLVFNTACFGDVLLCNALCQNIKQIFPESRIIFIADKIYEDAAKYQKDVDEVIIYDKKGINKGIFGLIKFVKNFRYKKIFASFITYRNERNILIAKLLKSRLKTCG